MDFEVRSAGDYELFLRACNAADLEKSRPGFRKGQDWLKGWLGFTQYNHLYGISRRSCMASGTPETSAFTVGSVHGGGAMVLFADGHTAFLRDSMELSVWRAVGTRNGGEAASYEN